MRVKFGQSPESKGIIFKFFINRRVEAIGRLRRVSNMRSRGVEKLGMFPVCTTSFLSQGYMSQARLWKTVGSDGESFFRAYGLVRFPSRSPTACAVSCYSFAASRQNRHHAKTTQAARVSLT